MNEKDKLILRLQHDLMKFGVKCKCVAFQTYPDCRIHYKKGVSFKQEPIPDDVKTSAERAQIKFERKMMKDELETRIRCWGVFVRGNPPDDLYEDQLWEVMNYIEENAHLLGEE